MNKLLRALCALSLFLGSFPTHLAIAAPTASPTSLSDSPTSSDSSSESPTSDPPISDSSDPPASDPPTSSDPPPATTITPYGLLKNHLFIKSVNPGFKVDSVAETGEMIELMSDADVSLPLDGVFLRYKNSSGTPYVIYEFPPGSTMIGETILLRYDKSPEIKVALEAADPATPAETNPITPAEAVLTGIADATYSKTLALAGSLELVYQDESGEQTIDSVCWTGKSGCLAKFSSSSPATLVRDEKTREFLKETDYFPVFSGGLYLPKEELPAEDDENAEEAAKTEVQCLDLEFSEILSYYETAKDEQFIELYNPTSEEIPLSGCSLRYKNKLYDLVKTNSSSENPDLDKISAEGFYVYRTAETTLTKNPNSENTIDLVDVTGDTVATMKYPHGQKKGTAYALIGDIWQTTYFPTPGAPNVAQEFKTCPLGKVLNEETGNCVKPTSIASVQPCPAGKYRNPETGRCKSATSSTDTKEPCKEGYERNPETGRCRKVKTNEGADYALVPLTGGSEGSSFIALWSLIALGALGLGFALFQFRRELRYELKHLLTKLKGGR